MKYGFRTLELSLKIFLKDVLGIMCISKKFHIC